MTSKRTVIIAWVVFIIFVAIAVWFALRKTTLSTDQSTEQKLVALNKQISNKEIELIAKSEDYNTQLSAYNLMMKVANTQSWVVNKAYKVYEEVNNSLNKMYATKKELMKLFTYGK
jgi:cell division protein YceG involved in septum cleavage